MIYRDTIIIYRPDSDNYNWYDQEFDEEEVKKEDLEEDENDCLIKNLQKS